MRARTLAHLSDLHFGRSAESDDRNRALAKLLLSYASFIRAGRVSVVPGNHDRLGEDVGAALVRGSRVLVDQREGLYIVRLDSTGPHNRNPITSHGLLGDEDVRLVRESFRRAPEGVLRVLLLHHHPLPLPEESLSERLATRLGMPDELERGEQLLREIAGNCDFVLHGHRHRPRAHELFTETRIPLHVWNAGSAPELGRVRVLRHRAGRMIDWSWVAAADIQNPPRRMGLWALTEGAALFLA
jgi:3',5'-cyclic AMP phosphodiesterase CpdA